MVTIERFSAVLKWFGPMDVEMMDRIALILKEKYALTVRLSVLKDVEYCYAHYHCYHCY